MRGFCRLSCHLQCNLPSAESDGHSDNVAMRAVNVSADSKREECTSRTPAQDRSEPIEFDYYCIPNYRVCQSDQDDHTNFGCRPGQDVPTMMTCNAINTIVVRHTITLVQTTPSELAITTRFPSEQIADAVLDQKRRTARGRCCGRRGKRKVGGVYSM